MKPKKLSKRLSLKKKTVAHLGNGQMGHIKGGDIPASEFPCDPRTLRISFCVCPPTQDTCNSCQGTCVSCGTCMETCTCPDTIGIDCPYPNTI